MVFNCEQYPPCAMTCRGGGGVRGGVFAGGGVGCATGSVMGSRIGSCTRSIMGSGMGSCTGSIMGSGMGSCTGSCVGNCMGNCVGCCMGSGVGSDMFPSGECNWLEGITSWVLAMVTACFHLIALLHHMAIVAWTLVCIEFNANDVFMGSVVSNSWRYLTGWNFVAQLTYLAIRCSSDLAGAVMYVFGQGNGGSCAKRGIDSTGNIMFQALIFPVSASVCALFWTLYHVEKELVFPGCLVDIVPKWWNHAMHSVPGGIAVLELFMTGGRHCWKRKRWIAICLLQFFLLCYDVCVLTTHMIDGVWLYPVYAVLPCWSMRILHLATIHLLALIFYYLGDQIGTYLYGNWSIGKIRANRCRTQSRPDRWSRCPNQMRVPPCAPRPPCAPSSHLQPITMPPHAVSHYAMNPQCQLTLRRTPLGDCCYPCTPQPCSPEACQVPCGVAVPPCAQMWAAFHPQTVTCPTCNCEFVHPCQ